MQNPVRITFHDVDASEALEKRIRQKIEKLEKHFDGIIGVNVVVESAHRHQRKGRMYSVRVDLTLPGGELVVSVHPGKKPGKHEKVYAAMNAAFLAIEKQIERFKEKQRGEVKQHQSMLQKGKVANVDKEGGFGFIKPVSGGEAVYFHENAVESGRFAKIKPGSIVRFSLIDGEGRNGPQANVVRLPLAKTAPAAAKKAKPKKRSPKTKR